MEYTVSLNTMTLLLRVGHIECRHILNSLAESSVDAISITSTVEGGWLSHALRSCSEHQ